VNLPLALAPLRPVLEAALHNCQPHAAARNIELRLACDEAVTARINPPLLEQAVINLVDNAIKYSEPGRQVQIEARREDEQIAVAVHDHGSGIAAEHFAAAIRAVFIGSIVPAAANSAERDWVWPSSKHIVQAHEGRVRSPVLRARGACFASICPCPRQFRQRQALMQ